MKRALPLFLTLLFFVLISNPALAQTADDNSSEAEDDAQAERVVRVSFVEGDVSFQRAGTSEWAAAIENLPLFAGDQIYAGEAARVELQIGRGSYIRLSEKTALTLTALQDDAVQFEIPAGMAFIRVEQLATAFQRFEVDTPNAALLLEQDGLYRINVRGDDDSELIVRRGAAEVSTEDGSFKVREGRRLLIDTSANGRLEVAYDTTQDDWDLWSNTRDATISSQSNNAPDYVAQYETDYSDFYGVSDLSSYGSWDDDSSYGHCWRPRVGYDWAPYRQGQWVWTRAGWTWISSEPWGWAPYHHGRWVFTPRGWAWVPGYGRSYNRQDRYQWRAYYRWRPALVGFFDAPSPRGHYVGWYPLAPGQRWRRPDWQRRGGDHSRLQYPTARDNWRGPGRSTFNQQPHNGRGVTLLPVGGFNRSDRSQIRPVAPDSEMSNWIKRGARPGLPEIKPAPIAIAPVTREGQHRRVAIPSNEIIRRPVVTRNRPADTEATVNPPRERRLITPRPPVMSNDGEWGREKKARRDEQRMKPPTVGSPTNEQTNNPAYEKPNRHAGGIDNNPRILPAERVEGDNNKAERKARRGNEATASPDNRPGNSPDNEGYKRPAYTPLPKQNDAANGDETRRRERKAHDEEQNRLRDEERVRQHQEERQRQREEENQKQNEERARQQQHEEHQRRLDEERQRHLDEERNRQHNEERARQRDEERQRRQEEERARQRDEEQNRQREAERARQHEEERQRRNDEERARRQQEDQQRRQEEERARQRNEEQNRQREEERQRQRDEERNRQRNEEQNRHREKPPANNYTAPSREERRQEKQERRAEREQRRKS